MPFKPANAYKELSQYISMLECTPKLFLSYSKELSEEKLKTEPQPRRWSFIEILAHIRACERIWGYSIYLMLAVKNPILPNIHPNKFYKVSGWLEQSFESSFSAYSVERTTFLAIIKGLSEKKLNRTCLINERSHSILSQLRRMALHEKEHWRQIECTFHQLKEKK